MKYVLLTILAILTVVHYVFADEGTKIQKFDELQVGDTYEGSGPFEASGMEGEGPVSATRLPDNSVELDAQEGTELDGALVHGENIRIQNGEVVSADEFGSGEMNSRGGEGIDWNGDEFTFEHADYFETPTHVVIDGNNIAYTPDTLSVGSGHTIQIGSSTISEVINFDSSTDTFTVDSAEAVVIDNQIFSDIGESTFVTQDDNLVLADITSAEDNNTFYLQNAVVIADNGETFVAGFSDNGTIINSGSPIDIEHNDEVIITVSGEIDPDTLIDNTNITTQIGESTVVINKDIGVVALDLAPTSRYINYDNLSQPSFSLYVPPYTRFLLYLRRHPAQVVDLSDCTQCGVIDFVNDSMILKGMIEYERLEDGLPIFTDIIRSGSSDNVILADGFEEMEIDFFGTLARFFSSRFEVKFNSSTYYRFHPEKPWIIRKIGNIHILKEKLTRTLADNTFSMHTKDSGYLDEYRTWSEKAYSYS